MKPWRTLIVILLGMPLALSINAEPPALWERLTDIDGQSDSAFSTVLDGSTVVAGGSGFLRQEPGEETRDRAVLLQGFDLGSGETHWSRRIDSIEQAWLRGDGSGTSYLLARNTNFTVLRDRQPAGHRLIAIESDTGATRWERFDAAGDDVRAPQRVAFMELHRGLLLYGGDYSDARLHTAPFLRAIDAGSGATTWEVLDPPVDSRSPFEDVVRGVVGRGRLIVSGLRIDRTQRHSFVSARSIATGELLWRLDLEHGIRALSTNGRDLMILRGLPPRRRNGRTRLLLEARAARSGELRWQLEMRSAKDNRLHNPSLATRGRRSFLAIEVAPRAGGVPQEVLLIAFDNRSGRTLWERSFDVDLFGRLLGLETTRSTVRLHHTNEPLAGDPERIRRTLASRTGTQVEQLTLSLQIGQIAEGAGGALIASGSAVSRGRKHDILVRRLR